MRWPSIVLPSVLAASCLAGACRETTPTSPTPQPPVDSSQSGSVESPRPPQPPSPPVPPASSGSCDATKVQWAIGEPASNALLVRARVAAGAESARFLRPNQPITMEYLGSRLNLGLDARDIVRSVVCG
jgi:hypothetical protein